MIEEKHHYGFFVLAMFSIVAIVFFVVYMVTHSNALGRGYDVLNPVPSSCQVQSMAMTRGGELASCSALCGADACLFGQAYQYSDDNLVFTRMTDCQDTYTVTDDRLHVRDCVCCTSP